MTILVAVCLDSLEKIVLPKSISVKRLLVKITQLAKALNLDIIAHANRDFQVKSVKSTLTSVHRHRVKMERHVLTISTDILVYVRKVFQARYVKLILMIVHPHHVNTARV